MFKTMIVAAGLSIGLLAIPVATTTPAQAGIDIDINIGEKQVSCRRGAQIVEDYGFRRVRPRNCSGRHYRYIGFRRGDPYIITLDSRRRRVTDVDELD